MPGLWKHKTRPVVFSLVVDDFGIKYVGKEHADHLVNSLQADYKITIDWTGGTFCGIDLNWNYEERTVGISMPVYIKKALLKFSHAVPSKPQDQPYKHTPIVYGAKQQFATEDTSPKLDKQQIKTVQNIVGTLLYYARAVDSTMAAALSTIASQQANGT